MLQRELDDKWVKSLLHGLPKRLVAALEEAAIVRSFDEEVLKAISRRRNIADLYGELAAFPFVRTLAHGLSLHDTVREGVEALLHETTPARHRLLHERAANYYERKAASIGTMEISAFTLESIYHRIRADEDDGVSVFMDAAEELVRGRMIGSLRMLLSDVQTYINVLNREESRLWVSYYVARLVQLEGKLESARNQLESLATNDQTEIMLRAYSLVDVGEIQLFLGNHEDSIQALQRGLDTAPLDSKLAMGLLDLSVGLRRKGSFVSNFDALKALEALERAREFYGAAGDKYALVRTMIYLKDYYLNAGEGTKARHWDTQSRKLLDSMSPQPPFLKMEVYGSLAVVWAWFGRLSRTEDDLREAFDIAERLQLVNVAYKARDLGYVLGMMGRYEEAEHFFDYADRSVENFPELNKEKERAVASGLRGAVLKEKGELARAKKYLQSGLRGKQDAKDYIGIPELYVWLGQLAEARALNAPVPKRMKYLLEAAASYEREFDMRWTGRVYFDCLALIGQARVGYWATGVEDLPQPLITATEDLPRHLANAEQLARQHEYNDCLALLMLVQGHLTWNEQVTHDLPNRFATTLNYYMQALIYALRFNRFMLQSVLIRTSDGTPWQSIINECQEHGDEGQRMLAELRDWWSTGVNRVEQQKDEKKRESISPLPGGISLIEAERLALEIESRGSLPADTVVKQLSLALDAFAGETDLKNSAVPLPR